MYTYKDQLDAYSRYENPIDNFKMLFKTYKKTMSAIENSVSNNQSFNIKNIYNSVSGNNWDLLFMIDLLDIELSQIQLVHKSLRATDYNIYVIYDEAFSFFEDDYLDQFDFINLMIKLTDETKKEIA